VHQLSERADRRITQQVSQDDVAPARILPLTTRYTGRGDGRSESRRPKPASPACSKCIGRADIPTLWLCRETAVCVQSSSPGPLITPLYLVRSKFTKAVAGAILSLR